MEQTGSSRTTAPAAGEPTQEEVDAFIEICGREPSSSEIEHARAMFESEAGTIQEDSGAAS